MHCTMIADTARILRTILLAIVRGIMQQVATSNLQYLHCLPTDKEVLCCYTCNISINAQYTAEDSYCRIGIKKGAKLTMTPPAVSRPRDKGVTSRSSRSWTFSLPSPDKMAACKLRMPVSAPAMQQSTHHYWRN